MYQLKSSARGYQIEFGGVLVAEVSAFDYHHAREVVNRANELLNLQIKAMTDRAKRTGAASKALELCGKLNSSRARLTQKTIIAANKARALWN